MRVPNSKEIANHVVPESCVAYREVRGEALTGVRTGQPLSRERIQFWVPTLSSLWKAKLTGAKSRAPARPGVVVEPGMCARSLNGNREISGSTSRLRLARIGKARSRSR